MSILNRQTRVRARAGEFCLFLALCLAVGAQAAEDPLWTAYTAGPPARVKALSDCADHLEKLRATAAEKGPGANWALDADVRFLLAHRTPASLAIGRELTKDQPDPYLAALVWTAGRLGHRELLGELPGTLARANSDAGRLCIINVLARLDTPQALKSMEDFLAAATPKTPEPLICALCEGIARTGKTIELTRLLAAAEAGALPAGADAHGRGPADVRRPHRARAVAGRPD